MVYNQHPTEDGTRVSGSLTTQGSSTVLDVVGPPGRTREQLQHASQGATGHNASYHPQRTSRSSKSRRSQQQQQQQQQQYHGATSRSSSKKRSSQQQPMNRPPSTSSSRDAPEYDVLRTLPREGAEVPSVVEEEDDEVDRMTADPSTLNSRSTPSPNRDDLMDSFNTAQARKSQVSSKQSRSRRRSRDRRRQHDERDITQTPDSDLDPTEDYTSADDRERREMAPEGPSTHTTDNSKSDEAVVSQSGTILEAAFVDPAYSWPPVDGEGRNAIELQATLHLLEDNDDLSINTTETMRRRMELPAKPELKPPKKQAWWKCCRSKDTGAVENREAMRIYEERRSAAVSARQTHAQLKKEKIRQREKEYRRKNKYTRVPEGILIYRLDTSTQILSLVSQPSSKTDLKRLVRQMKVVKAEPSADKSRRGIDLEDEHGQTATLIACEQRTATAWLEAMSLMFAKQDRNKSIFGISPLPSSRWTQEKLQDEELTEIEDQYLNLANYSHKLIRAGALPGGKKGSGGAGGIYYAVTKVNNDPWDDPEEEALEAIAKRRAVIKDSWDFYRMICSLLRDRNKYDEVFRRMKLDPVYPYLNSMTGLNDPGDTGYENLDKQVGQMDLPEYVGLSRTELARALCAKAENAMPSLVEICKALAGSLGMEEVGVGPIKEVTAAVRKAEKKYNGDVLKVTDFCRALLVVKDFPSLLALLELARDSFGPLIRRVKMSTLKEEHRAKPGGYRDCIINVELKGHICEIQIHLWPMWVVCGVEGYRHYRHCVEYNTDSFEDAFDALDGLDRKTMAELIVMAEEAVAETPLDNLEWYHEKYILDYFAEVGLFLKHGLDQWAEITLRHLIRLRMESPDIGPEHHETIILYRYLVQALQAQNKHTEASEVMVKVRNAEAVKKTEKQDAQKSLWDALACSPNTAYEMIVDPNRKYREEEERLRKEVKASKKHWRHVRQQRFQFLDADLSKKREVEDEKKHADLY